MMGVQAVTRPIESKPVERAKPDGTAGRCDKCRILDVTDCPLLDFAERMYSWKGLEECAMGDAVDKLIQAAQDDGRFINGRKRGAVKRKE